MLSWGDYAFFSWVLFGRRKEDDVGACEMGDGMRMCVEVVGDCGCRGC